MLKKIFLKKGIRKHLNQGRKGQGLVEFAMILPVVLTAFFVIIELARVYHAWVAVENGARFGVRYAITGEFDESKCGGGTCADESEEETARVSTVKDVAWAGSSSIIRLAMASGSNSDSGYFDVTVCEPDNLVGPASQYDTYSCTSGETAGDPGDHVAVIVEYNHPLIVPIISSIVPQIRLTAEREATVETFREVKSDDGPGSAPPPPQPSLTPPATTTVEPPPSEPSYDYCANIVYQLQWWDQSQEYDNMWKFATLFFNNNSIPMELTYYRIYHEGGLYRKRTKVMEGSGASSFKIINGSYAAEKFCPTSGDPRCGLDPTIFFPPRPGCPDDCWPAEIYQEYCETSTCIFDNWGPEHPNGQIPETGDYYWQADAIFTFRPEGEDPQACEHTWTASGNAPDHHSGDGDWDATPVPTPEDGGGGGGGGSTATPDPDPPGD